MAIVIETTEVCASKWGAYFRETMTTLLTHGNTSIICESILNTVNKQHMHIGLLAQIQQLACRSFDMSVLLALK